MPFAETRPVISDAAGEPSHASCHHEGVLCCLRPTLEMNLRLFLLVLFVASCMAIWLGEAVAQTAVVTGDARVDTLLAQMTLAEKRTLIHDSMEDPATYQ